MTKKNLLFLIGLFISTLLFAQSNGNKNNDTKDEAHLDKYTIKIVINNDYTFGYEIYDAGELKVKQTSKPFFSIPIGFSKKENAMAVAKWHAGQLLKGKATNNNLTIEEAKNLGVSDEDLKLKPNKNN